MDSAPTPQAAQADLAEADARARKIRRSDSQFRFVLVALAATYLALGIVVGLRPRGGPYAGPAVLAIFVCGIAAMVVIFRRVRAYSKAGVLRFSLACSAFTVWNALVLGGSFVTGWLGPHQPGGHFTVMTAVASMPLVVAAWLLGRRRG